MSSRAGECLITGEMRMSSSEPAVGGYMTPGTRLGTGKAGHRAAPARCTYAPALVIRRLIRDAPALRCRIEPYLIKAAPLRGAGSGAPRAGLLPWRGPSPRRPSRVDTTDLRRSARHADQCSTGADIPAPIIPLAQATRQRAGLTPEARTAQRRRSFRKLAAVPAMAQAPEFRWEAR
jgi:hypothetical protein